jgi:SAM-dependent methyltransferase
MLDVLEPVPDPVSALLEVERVLRPDGRLILSVPHKGTFASPDAQESILFAAGRRILLGKEDKALEHHHFTREEIVRMVGPDFETERAHMGGNLLFPLCGYALMLTDSANVAARYRER